MLQVIGISKNFSSQDSCEYKALDCVSFKLKKGEFFSLIGPSGCGKSTLLRIISGLETPTSGNILFNGADITHLSTQRRPFNMVFQRYALFPHLCVYDNVAFGLKIKKIPTNEIQKKVMDVLELVNLTSMSKKMPETLSGGQAQRVALARAIVNSPDILLLDEPLSALDFQLRQQMQKELKALQRRIGITFIFVTHDQEEAISMSDRIGLMESGKLLQVGTPLEIYKKPMNSFIQDFVQSRIELFDRTHTLFGTGNFTQLAGN